MSVSTRQFGVQDSPTESTNEGLLDVLHELWEHASDAALVIDDAGCCAYANPAFLRVFGPTPPGPRRLAMLTVESELLLLRTIEHLRRVTGRRKAALHLDVVGVEGIVGANAVVVRIEDRGGEGDRTVVQLHRQPRGPLAADPLAPTALARLGQIEAVLERVLDQFEGTADAPVPPAATAVTTSTPGATSTTVDLELRIRELTPRELEVVSLLRLGHRVSTIARTLVISPHTVRNHVKAIFRKLEVHSQAALVELFHGRE